METGQEVMSMLIRFYYSWMDGWLSRCTPLPRARHLLRVGAGESSPHPWKNQEAGEPTETAPVTQREQDSWDRHLGSSWPWGAAKRQMD